MNIAAIVFLFSLAAASCDYGTTSRPRFDLARRADSEYSYHGHRGPLAWHRISPNNSLCALGKNQSPVDLNPGETTSSGSTLAFQPNSYPEGAEFQNLGHTVQVFINGTMMLNAQIYRLIQFHFHTPSEHHLGNEHYPMEVHFVAQTTNGSLAVLAFVIEVGAGCDNILTAVLSKVGEIPQIGDTTSTGALDFQSLQSHLNKSGVFQYPGSLTTPPCTEGVLFNVAAMPLHVDVGNYRALKSIVKFNSRYIQNSVGQANLLDDDGNM